MGNTDVRDRLVSVNCGLEIKTPSRDNTVRGKVILAKDLYGIVKTCKFGCNTFKQLVYNSDYRSQILYRATAATLRFVLFVVADETRYELLSFLVKSTVSFSNK